MREEMGENRYGEAAAGSGPSMGSPSGPTLPPPPDHPARRASGEGPQTRIISVQEQQRAFRSAQRHTLRVKWLKWGLPLIAISIVVAFVWWVTNQKPATAPVEVIEADNAFQQDELIMQNPNLNGYTDGRSYEVVAKRAIQKVATPDVINLERLSARINDEQDQWVIITASKGRFNQTEENLDLEGSVDVKSSLGYNLSTDAVNVEMKNGYLKTNSPVAIRSKDIDLHADRLEAIDNGDLFRFSGNVRLRIDASTMSKNSNNDADQTGAEEAPDDAQSEVKP